MKLSEDVAREQLDELDPVFVRKDAKDTAGERARH